MRWVVIWLGLLGVGIWGMVLSIGVLSVPGIIGGTVLIGVSAVLLVISILGCMIDKGTKGYVEW